MVCSGTTLTLAAFVAAIAILVAGASRKRLTSNIWLFAALLALAAAAGREAIVWTFMLKMPLLNAFRLPIKFLAFVNIFVAIGGAIVLERILRRGERRFLAPML